MLPNPTELMHPHSPQQNMAHFWEDKKGSLCCYSCPSAGQGGSGRGTWVPSLCSQHSSFSSLTPAATEQDSSSHSIQQSPARLLGLMPAAPAGGMPGRGKRPSSDKPPAPGPAAAPRLRLHLLPPALTNAVSLCRGEQQVPRVP